MSGNLLLETSIEKVHKSMQEVWPRINPKQDMSDKDLHKLLSPVYANIVEAMKTAWAHAVSSGDYSGVARAAAAALDVLPMQEEPSAMQIRILNGFKQYVRSFVPFGTDKVMGCSIGVLPGNPEVKAIVKSAFVNTSSNPAQQEENIKDLYRWMQGTLNAEHKIADSDRDSVSTQASSPAQTPQTQSPRSSLDTPGHKKSLLELAKEHDKRHDSEADEVFYDALSGDEKKDEEEFYDALSDEEKQEIKSYLEQLQDMFRNAKPSISSALQTASSKLSKTLEKINRGM